jgi:recombinational DNA repair protein (RecF pathway)
VFAEGEGLLTIFARGARSGGKTSHLSAGLALFVSGEFRLTRRGEDAPANLQEANPSKMREAIRLDLDAYAAGAPALELLRENHLHGDETLEPLALAEDFLDRLDAFAAAHQSERGPEVRAMKRAVLGDALGRLFLDYLRLSGHVPIWSECPITKRALDPMEPSSFSTNIGGRLSHEGAREMLLQSRVARDIKPLSPDTLATMDRWLRGDGDTPPAEWKSLERPLNLLAVFARQHLHLKLESYRFFHQRFFE